MTQHRKCDCGSVQSVVLFWEENKTNGIPCFVAEVSCPLCGTRSCSSPRWAWQDKDMAIVVAWDDWDEGNVVKPERYDPKEEGIDEELSDLEIVERIERLVDKERGASDPGSGTL